MVKCDYNRGVVAATVALRGKGRSGVGQSAGQDQSASAAGEEKGSTKMRTELTLYNHSVYLKYNLSSGTQARVFS